MTEAVARRARLFRLAFALILITLLYNIGEGVVAIWSGLDADSLTLLTFGADSFVEVGAAAAVLWRLSYRDEEAGERAEQRALRFIGVTFLMLAAVVALEGVLSLIRAEGAGDSLSGVVLLGLSVTVMPGLAFWKMRVAAQANLPALAAEAAETFACSYLSLTALVGLLGNILLGWWWLDAVTALLMVPWLAKEGREALKGDACHEGNSPCSCRQCLFGLRSCQAPCCA